MNRKRDVVVAGGVCTAALIAATAFAIAAGGAARSTASASTHPHARVASEGIRIHGRWTIVVRDHGRVVQRRVFENALTSAGAASLRTFLGDYTNRQGPWAVEIDNPCLNLSTNAATLCALTPPGVTYTPALATARFPVLTVSNVSGFITLAGSFLAQVNGSVASVRTYIKRCVSSSGTVGSDCSGNSWFDFTQHGVSPSIPVSTGQLVQVTVKISFS